MSAIVTPTASQLRATKRRNAQPSSPFPFSVLEYDEARRRLDLAVRVLALRVLFPDPDPSFHRHMMAFARQEIADLTRSTDVMCGHVRGEWA